MSHPRASTDSHTYLRGVRSDFALGSEQPVRAGRYRLEGELARGGMGIVYRAFDPEIGRNVAVKVLKDEATDEFDLGQRFAFEARLTGQLQHPGVPPVYEVGALPDGRPFLAMKLIEGQTLAALLAARPPLQQARLLSIFEQVCQTVAFAHSHGVIHRDLKPANIMVGAFAEVQVMDWGLARLANAGRDSDHQLPTARSPLSPTALSPSGLTNEGGVMGTPAYMAPEQARGEPADERSDVFCLGAILCEMLTGQPPRAGIACDPLMLRLCPDDLRTVSALLDTSSADPELIALTHRCLAHDPAERPANAGVLAEAIREHQESVARRFREAELARVRAEGQRTRQRLLAALVCLLLLATLGIATAVVHHRHQSAVASAEAMHQRERREEKVERSLDEVRRHRDNARAATEDPLRWEAELVAAESALRAARDSAEGELRPDLQSRLEEEAGELAEDRADKRLADEVEAARTAQTMLAPNGNRYDTQSASVPVLAALARRGLKATNQSGDEAVRLLRARPEGARRTILAALDLAVSSSKRESATWDWLLDVLDAGDDDGWRKQVRASIRLNDRTELARLADEFEAGDHSPTSVVMLVGLLGADTHRQESLLRHGLRRHPGDFWLNQLLGRTLSNSAIQASRYRPARPEERALAWEAIAYLRVAQTQRPQSPGALINLAAVLRFLSQFDLAEDAFRRALDLAPDASLALVGLSAIFSERGNHAAAVAALRRATERQPSDAWLWANFGLALQRAGRRQHAIDALRRSLTLAPNLPFALTALGVALDERGERAAALLYLSRAVKVDPNNVPTRVNLGHSLLLRGDVDAAELHFRFALRLDPYSRAALLGLANALNQRGATAEALALHRRVTELTPGSAREWFHLGYALEQTGDRAGAKSAHERALQLDATHIPAQLGRARLLRTEGDRTQALAICRDVLSREPSNSTAWMQVSQLLADAGDRSGALRAARSAAEADPNVASVQAFLGLAYLERLDVSKALACFDRAIALAPGAGQFVSNRGRAFRIQGQLAAALNEQKRAIALDGYPMAYREAIELLRGRREFPAALALAEKAVRRHPKSASLWHGLSGARLALDDRPGAIAAIQHAISLDAAQPLYHGVYGLLLFRSGKFAEAAEATRQSLERLPSNHLHRPRLEQQLAECLTKQKLDEEMKKVLVGDVKVDDPAVLMNMSRLCLENHRRALDAARLAEMALSERPVVDPVKGWYSRGAQAAAAASAIAVEQERESWRTKARTWLERELGDWQKAIEQEKAPKARLRKALATWRAEPRFASLRGDELEKLPAGEREKWKAFWDAVEKAGR